MADKSRWLLVLALILTPVGVSSLGLGSIQLNSYLNQKLDAEVAISSSSGEELESLEVRVAPAEAFERFGIDRTRELENLSFQVVQGPGGSAVLRIRSSQPIVEPFLTFLVEATWAGGRFLREYTVLLDPPVFMPEQAAPAELAPPVTTTPAAGAVTRPAPVVSQPAPRSVTVSPAVSQPSAYGPIQRSETLWAIAEQVRPDSSVTMNQAMVALYQANPHAFDGNINRLRAGTTLNVPDRAGMTRLSASQASAEVRDHNTSWRGERSAPQVAVAPATTSAPQPQERLELVPPGQAETPAATRGADQGTSDQLAEQTALTDELMGAVQSMRTELEETRDLISLKDAEIAALQERLSQLEARGPAEAEVSPAETPATTAAPTPQPEAEVAQTPEPVAEQPPAVAPAAAPEEDGGLFSSIWFWMLLLLAAGAGGAYYWKQRQEEEEYDSWSAAADEPTQASAQSDIALPVDESPSIVLEEETTGVDTITEPAPEAVAELESEITEPIVEEAEPRPTGSGDEDDTDYHYPFEDTIAGAKGANLDQSDPLAEADFHMAYGLYDQAADLVGKAIETEPDRADLRMKMLDILFVWGKEDEFVEEARALKERLGDGSAAEWARVLIMGKQICPDEPLFEGEVPDVAEIAVESGDQESADALDFDIGDRAPTGEPDTLDFDLSASGESPVLDEDKATDLLDAVPEPTAELEIEDLGLGAGDIDMTRSDLEALPEDASQEPAAESDETVLADSVEDTLELESGDEAGTGFTEVLERAGGDDEADTPEEETGLTEMLDRAVDEVQEEPTGITETVNMESAQDDDTQELEELESGDITATELMEPVETADGAEEDTAEVEKLEGEDLDLDDLTAALGAEVDETAEMPKAGETPDGDTLIDEIFGDDEETKIAPGIAALGEGDKGDDTKEMPTAIVPDVTLSEVGTKLDLARAYIDMGDPDGAKSILEEVIKEGDEDQQAEARKLVDDLS